MTGFDFAVLAILGASVLLGLWRGMASEILALVAWIAAFVAARHLGPWAGGLFSTWIADAAMRSAAGMAAVFIGVLLVFVLLRVIVSFLLRAIGLGLLDRLLGALFGMARGTLVVLVAVLVGGMTDWPTAHWWREAVLAPPLETAAIAARAWLPADVARRIRYR